MSTFCKRLHSVAALCVAASVAQASPGPLTVPPSPAERQQGVLVRSITLDELGFRDGLTFRQLSGSRTIYFPVQDGAPAASARIVLDVSAGAATDAERFLQVSVGERIALSRSISGDEDSFTLDIPVDPASIRGGFLPIRFDYSGAHSDRVCVDERMSGDFLTIGPGSQLRLALQAEELTAPRTFAGLRPQQSHVELPAEDSLAGLAATIRAAALLDAETGMVSFGPAPLPEDQAEWATGRIRIDVSPAGPVSELSVAMDSDTPVLAAGGTDPQVGLYQLATGWSGLANGRQSTTANVDQGLADDGSLALAGLGAALESRLVTSNEDFTIPFQSSDIPVGRKISDIDLMVAAALDPDGNGATVSVFLNDVFLGSRPLETGQPERLRFPVAEGLVGRDNLLRVSVQRQPSAGACRFSPQGYPAQILPGSALLLADSDGKTDNFFELRQSFGDGVQLVVDGGAERSYSDLMPWIAGVAGSVLPDRATILPRADLGALDAGTPFIVVSDTDPGDEPHLVRMDQGRIEIRDTEGSLMFDGDGFARLGVVQIVERNGTPGLWLRPGEGPAPVWSRANPLNLDRGNLALIDDTGLVVATSTNSASLIAIDYPDTTSVAEILERYRPWLVGGLWIILTLIVLAVFQRIYRSRRTPPGGNA